MSDNQDRRGFLKATAGAAALTALGGAAPAIAQTKTIVFNDSGGASADAGKIAFGDPFEAATGVRVRITAPAQVAKLKAMVLVREARLSVQPVTEAEWKHICKLGGVK